MKVLSLFDGMSCGRIALDQLGIPVEKYYASEIDKYAMQVSAANYPDIEQVGDICNLDPKDYKDVDLILAGSPCQGFSFAGKQLAFDDPRSALFFEFIRLLKEIKPKYFLLENVRMKKEFLQVISQQVSECYPEIPFGIEPIFINSSLLSAQSRQRYYWTNIPGIKQPEDRGIVLRDILEDNFDSERDKAHCIDANYYKGASVEQYKKKHRRQLVNKPIKVGMNVEEVKVRKHKVDILLLQQALRAYKQNSKKTNKQIADETNMPITKVEHWFRTDSSFAIPSDDIWFKLKEVLGFTSSVFDKQIMEFEYRDGVFESTQRVYSDQGKSPTLTASNKEQIIETKPKQVGKIKDGGQGNRIYSQDGKSSTLSAQSGGTAGNGNTLVETKPKKAYISKQSVEKYVEDVNAEFNDPYNKKTVKGDKSTTLRTNSSNGNMWVNDKAIKETKPKQVGVAADINGHDVLKRVYSPDGKSPTINTCQGGNREPKLAQENLTWRKLTPLECERLQTVPDNYTNHVSNTQRYKMLGNGWTVEVIKHILQNMEVENDSKS